MEGSEKKNLKTVTNKSTEPFRIASEGLKLPQGGPQNEGGKGGRKGKGGERVKRFLNGRLAEDVKKGNKGSLRVLTTPRHFGVEISWDFISGKKENWWRGGRREGDLPISDGSSFTTSAEGRQKITTEKNGQLDSETIKNTIAGKTSKPIWYRGRGCEAQKKGQELLASHLSASEEKETKRKTEAISKIYGAGSHLHKPSEERGRERERGGSLAIMGARAKSKGAADYNHKGERKKKPRLGCQNARSIRQCEQGKKERRRLRKKGTQKKEKKNTRPLRNT